MLTCKLRRDFRDGGSIRPLVVCFPSLKLVWWHCVERTPWYTHVCFDMTLQRCAVDTIPACEQRETPLEENTLKATNLLSSSARFWHTPPTGTWRFQTVYFISLLSPYSSWLLKLVCCFLSFSFFLVSVSLLFYKRNSVNRWSVACSGLVAFSLFIYLLCFSRKSQTLCGPGSSRSDCQKWTAWNE